MKCKNTSALDASRLPCCLSFEVWACVNEVKESIPARHNVIILLNVRSNFCYWSTFSAGYCLTLPPTWSFLVRCLADIFARIVHFEILEISCQQTESTKFKKELDILKSYCYQTFWIVLHKKVWVFYRNALRFFERLRHSNL